MSFKEEEKADTTEKMKITSPQSLEEEKVIPVEKKSIKPKIRVAPDIYMDPEGFVEICFTPEDNKTFGSEEDEVHLVSEFTGWNPEKLTRENRKGKIIYAKKFKLPAGFKYKFRFLFNGKPISDVNYPEAKHFFGQAYNYINVVSGEDMTELSLNKNNSYSNPSVSFSNIFKSRLRMKNGRRLLQNTFL